MVIKGDNAKAAARKIRQTYHNIPSDATAKRWFQKFKSGDVSLERQKGGGRDKSFTDEELKELIDENPNLTLSEYGELLDVGKSCLSKRLSAINYTCKRTLWVPHQLSPANILNRKKICITLLEKNTHNPFLKNLMTSDESYILYETPHRRNEWSLVGSKPGYFAKAGLHPKKVMLCIWWDSEGVIYREFLPPNKTVDSDKYCEQLLEVRKALIKKRPAIINRSKVVFQHDNARPHVSKKTQELLEVLNWEVLPHPPYSPDIAPSDFHLFLHLKIALKGQKFKTTEELAGFVDDFFNDKPKSFFRDGIFKLPGLWEAIAKNDGKYL